MSALRSGSEPSEDSDSASWRAMVLLLFQLQYYSKNESLVALTLLARFLTRASCRCGAVPPTEVSYSTRAAVVHTTTLVH